MALHIAYRYKDQLQQAYLEFLDSGRAIDFIHSVYTEYEVNVIKDSWNRLEYVSVSDEGVILGSFNATISRAEPKVSALDVARLVPDRSFTFSRDLYTFCDQIFHDPQYVKVSWNSFTACANEVMYDRLCRKYGGRIVGIKEKDIRDTSGVLRGVKMYEFVRGDEL